MDRNGDIGEILDVAWKTLRSARVQLKLAVAISLVAAAGLVAWKSWSLTPEADDNLSTIVVSIVTMCGAVVAAAVFTLFRAGEEAATGRRTPDDWDANPTAFHSMLLVIPSGAALGAALLFASWGFITETGLREGTELWVIGVVPGLFGFWCLWMVYTSSRFVYEYALDRARTAERAQAEAAEARLSALQAQMNPHFLFNTLNTVAALVRTDARRAEGTVENLASVLRRTLDRSKATTTTLGEEVDFVTDYLAIERERFGDRLTVDWSIPDELRNVSVPTMALQPLVENALKYGVASRIEGGRITISAMAVGASLQLDVVDDGPGFDPDAVDGTGLGNLTHRLQVLYEDRAGVLRPKAEGGHVRVLLPLSTEADADPAAGPVA